MIAFYLSCGIIRFKLMKYHEMYHWLLAGHLGPPEDNYRELLEINNSNAFKRDSTVGEKNLLIVLPMLSCTLHKIRSLIETFPKPQTL
jgi:hypothetical protein